MILLAIYCGLLLKEPHLSATVLVFSIGAVLMIVGGIRLYWLGVGGGIAAAGFIAVVATGLISYAQTRIDVWLNPRLDPQGDGFQTLQSILAIGSADCGEEESANRDRNICGFRNLTMTLSFRSFAKNWDLSARLPFLRHSACLYGEVFLLPAVLPIVSEDLWPSE